MSTLRLHVPGPLSSGLTLDLPPAAARHVQVLRCQPGDPLVLFDGRGGEWTAEVRQMGRREVGVQVQAHVEVERELPVAVTLAVGMPANDRMDFLVEKATELGVAVLQPLVCERSVLRLSGERAERKREHWQGVAVAAAEQSGRTRVPAVRPVQALGEWLRAAGGAQAHVLSLRADARPPARLAPASSGALCCLSGPEGGLSPAEEDAARDSGFAPLSLGPRTLRADTAPLAVLAAVAAWHAG
ncbi:16S rRNA (uracil(1498)-N(3))-methyltransferase [Aquabacterium sp. J223]|uniref:16S rRNA (uracil(1498)-N(3))-methyltransferase n=1 Tax=Aquabacterium sp. J223 TaxID=2898431 RepID=UPI0021ADBF15|nr:16S rRNA (uracil(1498)-N(3))-methyltransferase [Aquabacterium sp. J223]UUX95860.1 16S rRNA (uracil(1498)-N(3))-methyltransferase [Aquabacterium sp. J223]